MADATDLLDLNVWLALAVADHPAHAGARRYWYQEAGSRIAFCRLTVLGFLRLSTNPTVMGGNPFTVREAWEAYRAFRRLDEVVLAAEPVSCEAVLESWVLGTIVPRLWTDAYLAAFARAGGFRLVSFDGDFSRFDGLDFARLQA